MKAITLHQPFASAIVRRWKTVETRSWPTAYRGPLAIHAAKTLPRYAAEFCVDNHEVWKLLHSVGLIDLGEDYTYRMPFGKVLATIYLLDCLPTEEVFRRYPERDTATERLFGNYAPGRFAWVLGHLTVLPDPVAARGMQGLWEWDGQP